MGTYDEAQICEKGHLINGSARRYPELNKRHCTKCGARTIQTCPECGVGILGDYHVEGIGSPGGASVPQFCHSCGRPYPWTRIALEETRAVVAGATGLNDQERVELTDALEETVRETPRQPRAVQRAKELLDKAGPEVYEVTKKLLTSLATEYAKQQLGF